MKRTVTVTFEFDDSPWFAEDEKKWFNTDATAYAMDLVKEATSINNKEFVKAELDGVLLVSKNHSPQHTR